MTWQNPKTDWHSKSQPLPLDFNRIEGNISELKKEIEQLIKRDPLVRLAIANKKTITDVMQKIPFDSIKTEIGTYYNRESYQYTPPAGHYRGGVSATVASEGTEQPPMNFILRLYKNNEAYNELIGSLSGDIDKTTITLSDILYLDGKTPVDLRIQAFPPWPNSSARLIDCFATFEKIRDV